MIYYFGDSNTAGIGTSGSPNPEKYFHIPYSTYLTELIGIPSKNYAEQGKNLILNVNDLIANLEDIEKNAKIVIFQFQFFCNPLLRFPEIGGTHHKDLVVTSYLLGKNPHINEYVDYKLSKEDFDIIADWTLKFEERRSYYELHKVLDIFKFLETKSIKCYAFYWSDAYTMELPNNRFILNPNGQKFAMSSIEGGPVFLRDVSNGEWDDGHTCNDWNEKLAKAIYKEINSKKDLE